MNARQRKRALMRRMSAERRKARTEYVAYMRGVIFTLDQDNNVIPARSLAEMMFGFEDMRRVVGRDTVGELTVSTVFLIVKHGFFRPEFFETAIFSSTGCDVVNRYETWAEAAAGHKAVVERLRTKQLDWDPN